MKKIKLKRLVLTFFLLPSLLLAQHTIKGVFSPAEDYNVVLLYKSMPTVSNYIASSEIKEDGSFQFQLDSTMTKGIYKIVYAIPQEDYNFDVIYNAKEDVELTFNAETGVTFQKSFENRLLASYTNSMAMVTQAIANYYSQQNKDTIALKAIFKTQKETQENFEKTAKGSIVFQFIKANKPYIPKKYVDFKTYVKQLKDHYFDYIDFNNKILQSSSFLEEKMLNYVFGMLSKTKDEINNYKDNIDVFCTVLKPTPLEVKRILLVDLWQQMVDLNKEAVANYLAETYLMDIAVALNDQHLLNGLMVYKDTSVGNEAPDFSFEMTKEGKKTIKRLSELSEYKNYVVVFWSTTCSYCLDEIPRLQAFAKTLEKGLVKVIAIAIEDEDIKWKTLKLNYPEFIHIYGKGKWDNEIGNSYGVTATPTYFILDKDKKIISKPEDVEALKAWFTKDL
ncbi:TlpA family protein disulfide reductase [Aestuariivivens marinum]|uniref:TlpA family protein disulfide reductase n=1 Tax=Aestuariivivens marinum TaxID=2913555 RepID=UPI001F5910DB|nr:TlpA disulfide reductase family protein [Aestuariivivens marinum]